MAPSRLSVHSSKFKIPFLFTAAFRSYFYNYKDLLQAFGFDPDKNSIFS